MYIWAMRFIGDNGDLLCETKEGGTFGKWSETLVPVNHEIIGVYSEDITDSRY
jgi:hypothetical protein